PTYPPWPRRRFRARAAASYLPKDSPRFGDAAFTHPSKYLRVCREKLFRRMKMGNESNSQDRNVCVETPLPEQKAKGTSRRAFFGQAGVAATVAAGILANPSKASANQQGFATGQNAATTPAGVTNRRVVESFELRVAEAARDALIPVAK